jgi:hypothetical protein
MIENVIEYLDFTRSSIYLKASLIMSTNAATVRKYSHKGFANWHVSPSFQLDLYIFMIYIFLLFLA